MWGPLFEKAWAKIKGSYATSGGGFLQTGLSSFVGVPIFNYDGAKMTDEAKANAVWTILKAAEDSNYIMASGTSGGGNDQEKNSCGIAKSHAYSILSAFEITDNGTTTKLLLARNPWGTTDYNSDWKDTDAKWTTNAKSQVPLNVDPTTSKSKGIFVIPMSKLINGLCMEDVNVAHYRQSEGYSDDRYDVINTDEAQHVFTVNVPAKSGDVYFSLHGYPPETIPQSCTTYSKTENGVTSNYIMPLVYLPLYRGNTRLAYQYYQDQFSRPLVILASNSSPIWNSDDKTSNTYSAGDTFKMKVEVNWGSSPAKDYTLKVYSK